MHQFFRVTPLALAIAVASPCVARAQLLGGGAKINIGAGATFPTGDFGSFNNTGYNLAGGINLFQTGIPIGARIEGMYNSFSSSGGFGGTTVSGGVTANVTYDIPIGALPGLTTLYGIGGIGYYHTNDPSSLIGAVDAVGWNIGAGIRFPLTGFSAYIESRYHRISNADASYFPVTFGLMF